MHLYGALVLIVTVSAACGLRCYACHGNTCTDQVTCPAGFEHCASVTVNNVKTKSCTNGKLCVNPIKCCSTDLCNYAIPTGTSAIPTGTSAIPIRTSAIPIRTSAIPIRTSAIPIRNGAIPIRNGAMPTGSSVLLLLASSAIITLFL